MEHCDGNLVQQWLIHSETVVDRGMKTRNGAGSDKKCIGWTAACKLLLKLDGVTDNPDVIILQVPERVLRVVLGSAGAKFAQEVRELLAYIAVSNFTRPSIGAI